MSIENIVHPKIDHEEFVSPSFDLTPRPLLKKLENKSKTSDYQIIVGKNSSDNCKNLVRDFSLSYASVRFISDEGIDGFLWGFYYLSIPVGKNLSDTVYN